MRVVKTVEDLATALSPIESADEAAVLLSLRGYTPKDCGLEGPASVPAARGTGMAFDLTVHTGGGCGAPLKEAVMRVDANGSVSRLSETVLKAGRLCSD